MELGATFDRWVATRASRLVPPYFTPNSWGCDRSLKSGRSPTVSPARLPAAQGTSAGSLARTSPGSTSIAVPAAARVPRISRREGFISGHYTEVVMKHLKWGVASALCLLPFSFLHAQQPTFRAGVTLVTTDVIPRDESGRFVADLTKDDFTILEDCQHKKCALFMLV